MLYGGDEREAKPYVIQSTSPYTSHDESSNTNSRRSHTIPALSKVDFEQV